MELYQRQFERVFCMSKIDLWQGDCLELMKDIPDGSIDLILCDPPYGTTACKWDTVIPFEPMWKELKRVIKPNGAIALFGSEPFSSALRMSNIKQFKYDWIWHKSRPTGAATSKKMPMKNHEIISIFYKKSPSYFPIKEPREDNTGRYRYKVETWNTGNAKIDNTKKTKPTERDREYRNPTTIKRFNSVSNFPASNKFHSTQKPVALLEYLIKTYTLEGETVLDFTMGSGSTGVAAKNLNRNFIGIELDETYFEIAQKRIEQATDAKTKENKI